MNEVSPWTLDDSNIASQQGWDVFECEGKLEIERIDDLTVFESDEEAILFVTNKAAEGDTTAVKALSLTKGEVLNANTGS